MSEDKMNWIYWFVFHLGVLDLAMGGAMLLVSIGAIVLTGYNEQAGGMAAAGFVFAFHGLAIAGVIARDFELEKRREAK